MDPADPGTPLPTTVVPPAAPRPAVQTDSTAKLVYVLYLVTLPLSAGLLSVIGVILAYVNVGDAAEPAKSHYRFQIRTFWLFVLYSIVSGLLVLLGIGFVLLAFVAVWFIVRCVKGLKYLDRGQPYPNAETWLW